MARDGAQPDDCRAGTDSSSSGGELPATGDVTGILAQIEQGDGRAAEQLLPLVYEELRKLAAAKMAQEKPGQTLQATALVHEAYLRLVRSDARRQWDSRGHFFAAAAEAMRRILVDNARRKKSLCHGGDAPRVNMLDLDVPIEPVAEQLLALDDALAKLAGVRSQAATLVKLRVFAGLTNEEVALALGTSERTARRLWLYARAWLRRELDASADSQS
jgi:RNA polymerase sigma factor (TIGR02999 family)